MSRWIDANCGPRDRSAPVGQILEVTIDPYARFEADFKISERCLGIIIQNVGTNDLLIENVWTVKPGSSFQIILNEVNILVVELSCTFTGAGTNQAEVMLVHTNHKQYSNY